MAAQVAGGPWVGGTKSFGEMLVPEGWVSGSGWRGGGKHRNQATHAEAMVEANAKYNSNDMHTLTDIESTIESTPHRRPG